MEALRHGRLPLWSPYNYGGAPLLGNGISAVLYPLNAPFLVLPDAAAVVAWAALRLLVAGVFTFLFARRIGLGVLGAGVSSLAFTFCGFLVVWLFWPQVNVAVWLPALFLACEALVQRPDLLRTAALAAVVGVQFLGGHPQTSLHILSAAGLYVLWRSGMEVAARRDWRGVGPRLAGFAGGGLLGAGAAALQLVPLGEYILESAARYDRLSIAPNVWAFQPPLWRPMLMLVCPYCFGSSLRGDIWIGGPFGALNFNEVNGAYVGLVSLLLAGLGVALGARRGIDLFFVVLGALSFCVVYWIFPVYNLVHALPLFRVSANGRMLLLLAFSLAMLAGRGADLVGALAAPRARRVRRWVAVAVAVGVLAVAAAAATLHGAMTSGPLAPLPGQHPARAERVARLLVREATGRVALLLLAGAAAAALAGSASTRRPLGWGVAAVLVLDLFAFGRDYNPAIPPELEYPSTAAIDFLRRQPGPFRILALDGGFWPNANVMYGLQEVRGYDALETPAYHRFLAATGEYPQPHIHIRTLLFSNFQSPLIDLLNVRYVLSDGRLDHPKLRRVLARGIHVYENTAALPRAFLAHETRVLPDAAAVERELRAPGFQPGSRVLLEAGGPALSGPPDPTATVEITRYAPERVDVAVRTERPAVLVLADAWFPGWTATVDGAPTPVLKADLLLRAVPVPAGSHRVGFRYRPLSVRVGAIVSLAAVGLGVGMVVAHRRKSPQ